VTWALPIITIDQDVIKKDEEKMMEKGLKDVFHENLEGVRCISKAKGNYQEIIMEFMCVKTIFGKSTSFMQIW
jgi:hypothetical protein